MPSRELVIVRSPQSASAPQFDYTELAPDIAVDARLAARRIQNCLRRAVISVGRDLVSMKKAMPHGRFGQWVALEFRMTARTAQHYMAVANAFDSTQGESVSYLPPTVLFALTRKSTPKVARDRLLARIKLGGRPGESEVMKIIRESMPPKPEKPDADESTVEAEWSDVPDVQRVSPVTVDALADSILTGLYGADIGRLIEVLSSDGGCGHLLNALCWKREEYSSTCRLNSPQVRGRSSPFEGCSPA